MNVWLVLIIRERERAFQFSRTKDQNSSILPFLWLLQHALIFNNEQESGIYYAKWSQWNTLLEPIITFTLYIIRRDKNRYIWNIINHLWITYRTQTIKSELATNWIFEKRKHQLIFFIIKIRFISSMHVLLATLTNHIEFKWKSWLIS